MLRDPEPMTPRSRFIGVERGKLRTRSWTAVDHAILARLPGTLLAFEGRCTQGTFKRRWTGCLECRWRDGKRQDSSDYGLSEQGPTNVATATLKVDKDVTDETVADAGEPLDIRWMGSSYLDIPIWR